MIVSFYGCLRSQGKISRAMQFLLANGHIFTHSERLSTPFLKELQFSGFGRRSAGQEWFGYLCRRTGRELLLTARCSLAVRSRRRVHCPLFRLLTWPLAYAMQVSRRGGSIQRKSFG